MPCHGEQRHLGTRDGVGADGAEWRSRARNDAE